MKKDFYILILTLFFAALNSISAQKVEILPYIGYETGAKAAAVTGGEFHLNGGLLYGGSFNFRLSGDYKLEISYGRMNSAISYSLDQVEQARGNFAVSYITLGGLYEYNPEDTWVPFGKFALGTIIYNPEKEGSETDRVGQFNISGGIKWFLHDNFGVRFQAGIALPLFFEGFYFTEGNNPEGTGIKTMITGVQGDFTLGAISRF